MPNRPVDILSFATITLAIDTAASDVAYDSIAPETVGVSATNAGAQVASAGIYVSTTTLDVVEDVGSVSVDVTLFSQPSANGVTLLLSSSDMLQAAPEPNHLVFTECVSPLPFSFSLSLRLLSLR